MHLKLKKRGNVEDQEKQVKELLNEMWDKLKQDCAKDPKTAVRISLLTPEKFKQSIQLFAEGFIKLKYQSWEQSDRLDYLQQMNERHEMGG